MEQALLEEVSVLWLCFPMEELAILDGTDGAAIVELPNSSTSGSWVCFFPSRELKSDETEYLVGYSMPLIGLKAKQEEWDNESLILFSYFKSIYFSTGD